MESYSNKRPRESNTQMSIESKRTMRKLDFSLDFGSSPKPNKLQYSAFNIDENSCGK
jgi:hypothetical protein